MIEINNKIKARVSEKWIKDIVARIFGELKRGEGVSIVLVGDEEIRKLNKKYRKKNRVTDVLSFSNLEGGKMIMPEEEKSLGEVIIDFQQAKRQAKEQGHSVKKELTILLIHGILHLIGYDDEDDVEKEKMRRKEAGVLKKLEISGYWPYEMRTPT